MYEKILGIALIGIGIFLGVLLSNRSRGKGTSTDIPGTREREQQAEEGLGRAEADNREAMERNTDITESNDRIAELIQRGKEILGIKDGDNQ